jgi:putative transcriptional regulator
MHNDVRKLREERSLSQGDLAKQLAVSRQTVNAIETGRHWAVLRKSGRGDLS